MTHRILFILPLLLFTLAVIAQSGNENKPPSFFLNEESSNIPTVITPRIDVNNLLSEDALNDQLAQPKRFAVGHTVDYDLDNSGQWKYLPDGSRIWRLKIHCPNALTINLLYSDFFLPEGVEYYVYQPDYSEILGKFTDAQNRSNGKFATALTHFSTAIVELYEPRKLVGRSRLEIRQINHGYRSLESFNTNGGGSGPCQVDVNCSPEGDNWQTEKKSVARYMIDGTRVCTGTLVNNTAEDGRQLFLTAYHCVDDLDAVTDPDASDYVFYWNFERSECGMDGSNTTATTTGATLLANHENSDFALFELHENPRTVADVHYAGWDATGNVNNGGVSIHHPGGDFKKIATHNLTPTADNWFNSRPPNSHLRVQPWNQTPNGYSITQSGSSGAPLFDNQKRVIGQLHGGSNVDCNDPANDPGIYGALHYSWNNNSATTPQQRLRDWLDPVNNGATLVLNGKENFAPTISFNGESLAVIEEMVTNGKDCSTYASYNFRMEISGTPTDTATIKLMTNGTATAGFDADFVILPDSFDLTAEKRFQDITLRVYDDALVEEIESIVVTYQLDAQDGNATTGSNNQQFYAEIESKDVAPTATEVTNVSFQENFENGLGQFTTTTTGTTTFNAGDVNAASSEYWQILPTKNESQFVFVNDDVCNCDLNNVMLISPNFDFSNTNDASLLFDYAFSGQDYEKLEILVSTDNGLNWSAPIATIEYESAYLGNGIYQTDWVENERVDLKNYDNVADLRFAFRYSDGNVWAYGTAIDNVRLITTVEQNSTPVQMAENATEPAYANIPPFSIVHFYHPNTNHIIATIENESDHDYGCTTLAIDRAGAGATYAFVSDTTRKEIFSKTLKFTPEHQSTTTDFILTTYHQPEEISAWMGVAQQSNTDSLRVIQVVEDQPIKDINESNAALYTIKNQTTAIGVFGDDLTITSIHTGGLSAFGFGLHQYTENSDPLPVELLYFQGKTQATGNYLEWQTASENNVTAFRLERSLDGMHFNTITTLAAAQTAHHYTFLDQNIAANQRYFYRLQTMESAVAKVVSPIIQLQSQGAANRLTVAPNPFNQQIEINGESGEIIEIYDLYGRLVQHISNITPRTHSINTNNWKSGVYIIKSGQQVQRIVKY